MEIAHLPGAIPGPNPFVLEDEDASDPPATPIGINPTLLAMNRPQFPRAASSTSLPSQLTGVGTQSILIPGLIDAGLFLPIPTTDPLSTLLTKYVVNPNERPPRDVSGDWQNTEFHTLVMTNSWRALARMARDRIATASSDDLSYILGLWYLRLSCLARMRLSNQASAECDNLFNLLNAIEPPDAKSHFFEHIIPFELEVFRTRLRYWANDMYGYIDELYALLSKCRRKLQESTDGAVIETWKERGSRVCLIIASQLVEMKQFIVATNLLEPLCSNGSPELRSAIGHIYLQAGCLGLAQKSFDLVCADSRASESLKSMNSALQASASGDWDRAIEILASVLEKEPDNAIVANNLAAALLSKGQVKRSVEILEALVKVSPSNILSAEPFLFNLSTLYELRSATALDRKVALLIETAKWSGDGLRTSVLKLG